MANKLQIVQFDGEENYHTVVDLILFMMGIDIVERASSINSAKKVFEKIEAGKIKPNVAIVSAFLQKDHKDGEQVAKKLRELIPDIKIIAYTVLDDVEWGDYLAIKTTQDQEKGLIKILEEISGKEYRFDNSK